MQNQQPINKISTSSQLPQLQTPFSLIEAYNNLDASDNFDSLYSSNNMIDLGFDAQSFELQNQLMSAWQGNGTTTTSEYLPELSNFDVIQENGCMPSYNGLYDSDNSVFQSNKHSFSFNSMLSAQSSLSPTPLNSNATSITEDERESYSSNLIKFEIPADVLDVSEFM